MTFGINKQQLQIAMIALNPNHSPTNHLTLPDNPIGLTQIDRTLNRLPRNDLPILLKTRISRAKLRQCPKSKGFLIVQNELIPIFVQKRLKRDFHFTSPFQFSGALPQIPFCECWGGATPRRFHSSLPNPILLPSSSTPGTAHDSALGSSPGRIFHIA